MEPKHSLLLAGRKFPARRSRFTPGAIPQRIPINWGGTCEAFYDGKQWPCTVGSRHVEVHWFAYVGEPLGLTGSQLEALRREYVFGNLPEEAFMTGIAVVPIVANLMAIVATTALLWPRYRGKVSFALLVAASGVASLSGTFVLALLLTRGFWD